jgi:hypothetical protein
MELCGYSAHDATQFAVNVVVNSSSLWTFAVT